MSSITTGFSSDGFVVYDIVQDDGTKSSIKLTADQADAMVRLTIQAITIIRSRENAISLVTPAKDSIIITDPIRAAIAGQEGAVIDPNGHTARDVQIGR